MIVVGALGVVAGIIGLDWFELSESPLLFVAITVNLYGIPLVRPFLVVELLVEMAVNPPGSLVTVYFVIAEPPFEIGGDQYIVASVFPGIAETLVGLSGTVEGIISDDGVEGNESPFILVAKTVNIYGVPFVRPVTVADVIVPFSVVTGSTPASFITV